MAPAQFFGNTEIADSLFRMAAEDRLPQTLLFTGPAGIGKATLARLLAAVIEVVPSTFKFDLDFNATLGNFANAIPILDRLKEHGGFHRVPENPDSESKSTGRHLKNTRLTTIL